MLRFGTIDTELVFEKTAVNDVFRKQFVITNVVIVLNYDNGVQILNGKIESFIISEETSLKKRCLEVEMMGDEISESKLP